MTTQLQLGGYEVPQCILSPCDPSVRMRRGVEYAIVRKLIESLLKQGFVLRIDHDGEEDIKIRINNTGTTAMREMFACDQETLFVYHPINPDRVFGWVKLVYGNDGWDVICDYTTNLEDALKEVNEYAEQFGG